jgi:hypothetical protein
MQAYGLRELQLGLRRLIATPELAPGERASLLDALPLRGDERLSAEERVAIYAAMHFVRIRDALAEDYPGLLAALGDERFAALAESYLRAHPTDHPSLRYAGRNLPSFLAAQASLVPEPWAADLARVEWALVDSFDAPDDCVLTRESLETLAPEAWGSLHLRAVRSLVVLELGFEVDTARERLLASGSAEVARTAQTLRVWRQQFRVYYRRMDETEARAVERLAGGGLSFAELCAWLAEETEEAEAAPAALRLLECWLSDELLVSPGS